MTTNSPSLDPGLLCAASDRILILVDEDPKETFGDGKYAVIRGKDHLEDGYLATVVSVGPGRPVFDTGELVVPSVRAGDRVIVTGNGLGHPLPKILLKSLGDRYYFTTEDMILCTITDDHRMILRESQVRELLGDHKTNALAMLSD